MVATMWTVVSFSFSLLITPFLMVLLGIIFLASIGKSLGVRRLYVNLLLKIFELSEHPGFTSIMCSSPKTNFKNTLTYFEYGRQHIEIAQKDRQVSRDNSDDEEEEEEKEQKDVLEVKENCNNVCNKTPEKKMNGVISNNLISREDLILAPDPVQNYKGNNKQEETSTAPPDLIRRRSFETLKREFQLSDLLDYVKAGVEAIIEDEVTHRFEAEELKSWNLLTRTNQYYEFISWRLTVIWMAGFFVRYFFLLPLRVMICFIGICWMLSSTGVLSFVPKCWLKNWLVNHAYRIAFRILACSLTVILTSHNIQYRPRAGGVCVANHTSPIDVGLLSTETTYALVMWLTACTAVVGYVPEGPFKRWLNHRVSIMCFGVLSSALSSVITYHNPENRPKSGICVANHTSPIDVLVLACDNCYALIGQRHGGFLGLLQRALARASPHIWFERSEVKDREAVARRLREHVSDPNNPPILIFPEGTCINNTSVMQFKKGSFEVGGVIYPVAIKYDPKFGDAFWNSSRYSMMQYLYMMMTSWAIVCDVWYLPPMYQQEGETAIDFANRVKGVIARQGGLVDLMWDGQLKRMKPKKEWKENQQKEFSKRLKLE
ncbi:glycerol-3-phosphate acyltransferase 3-like isoform X3 [Schistocerca gregaria]|uniref:glycerol-3-phosphate acyltransferase 3-like isoform X3 n=1 Tax=Schistocerca gregaria TaxID=7010 RepID=UPI00211E4765|nr:glycerol-3-phosphate acyltransferase 3-like isoform X3 [Schistocerca gregaria]